MKKIKMIWIKLAFAALFFTLIAESHYLYNKKEAPAVVSQAQATSTPLVTSLLADAIAIKNAEASTEVIQPRFINVKGKLYPYQIVIPKIKVNAGVVPMGVTSEGRMAVPDNYTEVGWYNLGTRPGEAGSAVMGAHVDNGGNTNGVFKNLKNLQIGDPVYIGDGNGNVYHYVITERKIYPYRTQNASEVFLRNDTERLNLITCFGTWLPYENTYNQRLVVSAELQKITIAHH
jgi:LPXTG-site transpeptidase (sortase) family protein